MITKTRVKTFIVFAAVMAAAQVLGALLFPAQWQGATNPWQIVALSLGGALFYSVIMALLEHRDARRGEE